MKNNDFDIDLDLGEEAPKEKKFSFNDLDLGLDFDLSFLDDIDESVLEEPEVKPEPVKKPASAKKPAPKAAETPVKKPAAKKPAAPAEGAPTKKPTPKKPSVPADGAPVKKPVAKKPAAPVDGTSPAKKPAAKKPAPQSEAPAKNQKRGPRLGGVIFYTLYFMFILIFFVGVFFGLNWLRSWLTDFEYAQPTVKAQQVFDEVFTNPNWGDLYDAAGVEDSPYEGKDEYVNYMNNKVGGSALTYTETSAGLDKTKKKFLVFLGEEKVASFTLIDKNNVSSVNLSDLQSLEDLEKMTDIPNWTLGAVEVFFEREESYRIVKMDGMTATVNGVALDESFTIQKATTLAEEYLPEGTVGFVTETQEITGLMELPDVLVTDKNGNNIPVSYDELTRTFTAQTESNTMSDEEKELALEAARISCKWMLEAVTDRGTVAKYFDPTSDAYNSIVKNMELWVQDYNSYTFGNESVTDYARYSDDIFSVRVKTDVTVVHNLGDDRVFNFDQSMFFRKTDSGKWLCFETTNKNISEPVGRVRLTFKNGDTVLTTDFFDTNKKEIITPMISVPEGQVFSGWITITEDAEGSTVYNLEFTPDPTTGKVAIPDGTTLKPMTLYAWFEDASAASGAVETPTEPAADTAPAETTAPATT
ncbi:MAG: hypothetical protein J6J12_08795 [Oscillospiraceae bacterium]|nr:hypothetical protein [Oscillospiraceae bacterium]